MSLHLMNEEAYVFIGDLGFDDTPLHLMRSDAAKSDGPYKPGVAGSKPAPPTNKIADLYEP
jgi:hypothetical protein